MSKGLQLEIQNVGKTFGPKSVLQGVQLTLTPGQFVAIVGKSGCGKSTLLRIIAGLDSPTTGEASLDGRPITGIDPRVRVVFQDARLLPWKRVLANVAIGSRELSEKARAILEHVGLGDHLNDWPAVLSGGQRQRVSLARALLTEPGLLLFDEPLGALDALTRLEMQALLERLWLEQKFTALLVTHDVEEAVALSDRVILIEAGRITLDVPVDLPRPRDRNSAEFIRLKSQVLEAVMGKSGA